MKKYFSLFVLTLLLPTVMFAMTREEILSEIGRLLSVADAIRAQMRALGVDPSSVTVSTVSPGVTGTPRYESTLCPSFTRTLSVGTSGNDVVAVQRILNQKGFLSSAPTGYFGTLTADAVSQFQASKGLTPSGIVDSQTASAISVLCGGNGTSSGVAPVDRTSLSVSPSQGASPLQVLAAFAINGTTCTSYALDWGDGTAQVSREGGFTGCVTDNINRQLSHTYQNRGTFMVTLRTIRGSITSAPVVQQVQVVVQ